MRLYMEITLGTLLRLVGHGRETVHRLFIVHLIFRLVEAPPLTGLVSKEAIHTTSFDHYWIPLPVFPCMLILLSL
jgi:hypothetical protein